MRNIVLALLSALLVASCSHRKPPVGRWEGAYESSDVMIAARLEVESDGQVRVSAPDYVGIASASGDDRGAMRERLASELAAEWDTVAPRPMDFDGDTFRKPGGIAPQAVWNRKTNGMQLVVYLGTRPSIRFALRPVADFTDDPWTE